MLTVWPSLFPPAITCPALSDPANGMVTYSSGSPVGGMVPFDVVATYQCDPGYALVGATTRTCTGDGSSTMGAFTGDQPSCEGDWNY